MVHVWSTLAFAGVASAAAITGPSSHDVSKRSFHIEPCSILTEAWIEHPPSENDPSYGTILDVPPSIAVACLKSVPVIKDRDLKLLEYLRPLVSFQSTIGTLKNPPETYLLPGIDIWAGFDAIEEKLRNNGYESQYEVMTDILSIFVATHDNHFSYVPGLLRAISFRRDVMEMISLSGDGLALPQIYLADDVYRGNHHELDYQPSHVVDVDGVPVTEFLINQANHYAGSAQDPDAQFNQLFGTVPGAVMKQTAWLKKSFFEIPDNYTVTFVNGTTTVIKNHVAIPKGVNLTGIVTGADYHRVIEIPPEEVSAPEETPAEDTPVEEQAPVSSDVPISNPGYPIPISIIKEQNIAGYFLHGAGYGDVAVLSIVGFMPAVGTITNLTEHVQDAQSTIASFLESAKQHNRNKLIIDVTSNAGGYIAVALDAYRTLFPQGEMSNFDRLAANDALTAAANANYTLFHQSIISIANPPVGLDRNPITSASSFIGPEVIAGDNVTVAFQEDFSKPILGNTHWLNGAGPDSTINEPYFSPENMLILTDGTCGSACTIFVGLLTRNHNIRAVALGGRPQHLPMQTMGGVRGPVMSDNNQLAIAFEAIATGLDAASNTEGLAQLERVGNAIPGVLKPPLTPVSTLEEAVLTVNFRNGYALSDPDSVPFHFQYQAANCRLFYTQKMAVDVVESWRRVAKIGWHGAPCVDGSTVNSDSTISSELLPYTSAVRSKARPVENPGKLA